MLRGQQFFKYQQLEFDLCPCDLKINLGQVLSRGIQCTKFGNFTAKESRDRPCFYIIITQAGVRWIWNCTLCIMPNLLKENT